MDDFRKRLNDHRAGKGAEGRQRALHEFNELLSNRFVDKTSLQGEFLQTGSSTDSTMVRVGVVSREILKDKERYFGKMRDIVDTSLDEKALPFVKSFFDWVEDMDLRAIFVGMDLYLLSPDSGSNASFIQELREAQRLYAQEHCDYDVLNEMVASRFQSRDQIESEFMYSSVD